MTPEQLQNQRNMQAAGLTAEQQAGVTSGKGYAAVPNASIQPSTAVTLPTPTPDTTNYNANVVGGQATIDANNKGLTTTPATPPSATDQYVSSLQALGSQSNSSQYATDYANSGVDANQQAVIAQQQALNTAQSKLAGINARLAGVTAAGKVAELKASDTGETLRFAGGETARVNREAAIAALPIQAEALGAQAEVQAAQGNVQLAQETLRLAQDRLNTVFTMHTEDAKNRYNAQKDLISAVYTQASAKEKTLLDAKLKEEERAYQERKDNVNNAQQWAIKAMENGQASLASQITVLDPKSKTYTQDLAKLQGQITPNTQDKQLKTLQIQKLQNELSSAVDVPAEKASNLLAYTQRYASDGKLPSPTELKTAGLSVGQVQEAGKILPKPKGALVSTHTGVPPTNLSAEENTGITAMSEIVNDTLPKLQELFPKLYTGLLGGIGGQLPIIGGGQDRQDYATFRQEFINKLLKARSGATVTPQEYQRYADMIPGTFNQVAFFGTTGEKKLKSLAKSMKTSLDNTLSTKQVSIYGYSTVNLGGNEYKVGDTIEVNGIQGHILPDGSIAVQ